MTTVRIVAAEREGGRKNASYKIILVCQIDQARHIVPGEWFGCVKNENITHPFVLQRSLSFYYGGEEHWQEPTNIGQRQIAQGSLFTLSNDPRDPEKFEATYEITTIHVLDG